MKISKPITRSRTKLLTIHVIVATAYLEHIISQDKLAQNILVKANRKGWEKEDFLRKIHFETLEGFLQKWRTEKFIFSVMVDLFLNSSIIILAFSKPSLSQERSSNLPNIYNQLNDADFWKFNNLIIVDNFSQEKQLNMTLLFLIVKNSVRMAELPKTTHRTLES